MLETKFSESFTWLWEGAISSRGNTKGNTNLWSLRTSSLTGKKSSLLAHCPLSSLFLTLISVQNISCGGGPIAQDSLCSILFLQVCSFIRSPNLSCRLDVQAVEMVEHSIQNEGHR